MPSSTRRSAASPSSGRPADSYDALPQTFMLPADIGEDDWIEFGLMGAYTQ